MSVSPGDARLDTWLDGRLDGLTESLHDAIDVDAGLRDARLADRARSLDAALDALLDVDAGLDAILSRSEAGATSPMRAFAQDLARRPPLARLRLRSRLPLAELRLVRQLGMALRNAYHLVAHLDRLTDSVDDHAANLALAVASDLDGTGYHAVAVRFAHDLGPTLDGAISLRHARATARTLGRIVEGSCGRAFTAVRQHAGGRDLPSGQGFGVDDWIGGITAVIAAATDFTGADLTGLDLHGVDLLGCGGPS